MDVNSINPILSSFVSILPQIGFQTVEKREVKLIEPMLENIGLLINISMVGPLRGSIVIGMEVEAAKQFASKMMMGMPVLELDELAQSAISEMGNMVCATACTNYNLAGIDGLDISPPTLLIGEGGQVKLAVPKVILVRFEVDGIMVNVYIGLFEA
ncbi:MAG: chemotaxis protein CheX [Firmicutes bacterium]|nr:chemotaxis protein CheX [Bacillota bacterium]